MNDPVLLFATQNQIPIQTEEPLSRHTTFQIGGPARYFALPQTVKQLCLLLDYAFAARLNYAVIGNGSNLLAEDCGFDGLVIRTPEEAPVWLSEEEVSVSAGYLLSRLAAAAADRGLSGLTFAQGIPGTVGGGIVMNAGAYGGQISDVLFSSECWTPEGIKQISFSEHRLSYRHSIYTEHPDWVVLRGVFRLKKGDPAQIAFEMADYAARRREKQPLEWPSAGSTFQRPAGNFAGKLIEDCGLKGFTIGGAQVSEKHAGFLINRNHATSEDMHRLMARVTEIVEEKTGVHLVPEVKDLK